MLIVTVSLIAISILLPIIGVPVVKKRAPDGRELSRSFFAPFRPRQIFVPFEIVVIRSATISFYNDAWWSFHGMMEEAKGDERDVP